MVRYYGGTNLGVGGLMRAYAGVASIALKSAVNFPKLVRKRTKFKTVLSSFRIE